MINFRLESVYNMRKKTYFMVGMPSSGKTTYMASLCRLVLQANTKTMLHMDMSDIPEGMEYIEKQLQNLLKCKEVDRTLNRIQYQVKFPLIDETGQKLELILPDQSGEIFRDFVCDRRLLKNVADRLRETDELLFFINTNTMAKQEYLSLKEKSAMKMLEEISEVEKQNNLVENIVLERKKEKTNQSEVVDLLQSILFIGKKKFRIKFIISAWDKVEKEYGQSVPFPEEYLKRKLPLLYQYLKSNIDKVEFQIWGVSAQGGDFGDEEEKAKMLEDDPTKFVKVIDVEGKESQDLTKILCL